MNIRTIILAPASFKGTLRAREVSAAMRRSAESALPDAHIIELPVSDGGEGMLDIVMGATGGRRFETEVSGPLPGQRVRASWGITPNGSTAVIEMAQAAGLLLVPDGRRDPGVTTTFGVGELLREALGHKVDTVLIGLGGSATNDGGAGMAEALGVRFLDSDGRSLPRGGGALNSLSAIDMSGLDPRLKDVRVSIACDVRNPLLGPSGATRVFAPQKGATPEGVEMLEGALSRYADCVLRTAGVDIRNIPGAGAAGGLGGGLVAFCNARLESGIDLVLDLLQFDRLCSGADLVVAGEGRMDLQTALGKAVAGVVRRAHAHGIPVAAVVGILEKGRGDADLPVGLADIVSLTDRDTSEEAAMANAAELVERRTAGMLARWRSR